MKSQHFLFTALSLGLILSVWDSPLAQTAPNVLNLTAKVRDFAELPNAASPCNGPYCPNHPDFNTYNGDCRGAVDALIDITGSVDTTVFPFDNRNPRLLGSRPGCYTSTTYFNDWFNDRYTAATTDHQNRPFLYTMVFNRNAQGMYVYDNPFFFPLDNDSISRGITKPIPGAPTTTFGHLNNVNLGGVNTALHNYGFTTEFHAAFTYIAADANNPAQIFDFTGDDDVWVFINGKLVIDLGGVHAAESQSVSLDAATAANLGLENGKSYMLDFFLAERRIVASDAKITTSLQLVTQKVDKPVANPPGEQFPSQVSVLLTTATSGATIYYTTDGTAPDSNSTKFDPAAPIHITTTTTLKAIAYRKDWKASDVMTEVYTRKPSPSTLDILDQNGNPLPGYLSELNPSYKIKVVTNQAGLGTITVNASTQTAADKESPVIANPTTVGDVITYLGSEPLVIGAATASDGKSQASPYDSLIVRWVNPTDPTDIAEKHVLVRPAPKQAKVFFATDLAGTAVTDSISGTATQIYVFVSDEILPSTAQPTIKLTTTRGSAPIIPQDTSVLHLTVVSPGLYRATVQFAPGVPVPLKTDSLLQVMLGDQVKASYTDPLDKDSNSANAGYGVQPEIDGSLAFTDKAGVPIPNGIYYSPVADSLYITYQDDFILGKDTVIATLSIVNRKGTADPDLETVTLKLVQQTGSTGIWKGSIKLAAGPHIVKGNDTAETYVLGEVHGEVTSHTKANGVGPKAADDLLVAFPNKDPQIDIEGGGGPGVSIKRLDSTIVVRITDQSLSPVIDTITFDISCSGSHDALIQQKAIETDPGSGIYQSTIISKSEGPAVSDSKLQCSSHDLVVVSYTDPVYGDIKKVQVDINEPVTTKLFFTSDADGKNPIASVSDGSADFFYVVVNGRNPDINVVDHVSVTMTVGGETETFLATETGNSTNTFIAKVPFKFVTGTQTPNNGTLEAKVAPDNNSGLVTAVGKVTVDGQDASGSIILSASLDKVVKAYIKDTDGDGSGDKVYIVFQNQLGHLPSSVIAHWNSDSTIDAKTADKAKISFLNSDSNVVVLDFTSDQFKKDSTAVNPKNPPKATLPSDDALFGGQRPLIEDSIGPVIIYATKHPVNPNLITKGDPSVNYDTLVLVLSEPLKSADTKFLKYGSCSDYAHATIVTVTAPPTTTDPNTYVVIVDKTGHTPTAGNDCVYLNADGAYTDVHQNIPPKHGVKLGGTNGPQLIALFRGYPPVAGLSSLSPSYQVANQDPLDESKGGIAQDTSTNGSGKFAIDWIPPVGFDDSHPSDFNGAYVNGHKVSLNDSSSGSEVTMAKAIPDNISAVEVVTRDPYIAHIFIYDHLGNFLRSMVQAFGFAGEIGNVHNRSVPGGLASFLVWDMKDRNGQIAGNGVYVWKVNFQFKNGKQEVQYTRTGIMRNK